MTVYEHEWEPVPGLPAHLPAGETILWQGAPDWTSLARHTFHAGKVGVYFALLLAWRAVIAITEGETLSAAALSALWLMALALTATGLLVMLAWLTGRTTLYTITNRRVVMRYGIALPMTLNIPFKIVTAAALKPYADGTGELSLTLTGDDRVAYLALWPNARPWHLKKTEPMLRCVPDAKHVAKVMADALAAAAIQPDYVKSPVREASAPSLAEQRPLATAAA